MKRIISAIILCFVCAAAFAAGSKIYDIDIRVQLQENGDMLVCETWNVEVSEGTEWYLVRKNLGIIEIKDLRVFENGEEFTNIGVWDVNYSRAKKAGKCGMLHKADGYELCWGIGEYGAHVFEVSYKMTSVVEQMKDYDCLHVQFVNPGLSAHPQHVRVEVGAPVALDEDNAKAWGFGYPGEFGIKDGKVWAESSSELERDNSVILLVRLDKGIFSDGAQEPEIEFETVLEEALEDSSFTRNEEDEDDGKILVFAVIFTLVFLGAGIALATGYTKNLARKRLGVESLKEISPCTEIPYGGDLLMCWCALRHLSEVDTVFGTEPGRFAAAFILNGIRKGYFKAIETKNAVEISFMEDRVPENLHSCERRLITLMKQASGDDGILQDREFSRWGERHGRIIRKWIDSIVEEGEQAMIDAGYLNINKEPTDSGRLENRKLAGLRKYHKDMASDKYFRLSGDVLAGDYLIYSTLLGFAKKFAKDFKELNLAATVSDQDFYNAWGIHPVYYWYLFHHTSHMGTCIVNADAARMTGASGSTASFGGGGGFHGGGFGGGAR